MEKIKTYTIEEIANKLDVQKALIKKIQNRHRLKQVELGHSQMWKPDWSEEEFEGYVFYEHAIPVFEALLDSVRAYSDYKEKEREEAEKEVL